MPYTMKASAVGECKGGERFVVVNQDTGKPVPGGCHATREEAQKHLAALMMNVPDARRPGG